MLYNNAEKEVCISSALTSAITKTFIIDHPIDSNKYLIHSCVEGPSTELIYRGKERIFDDETITISLPEYAKEIGFNFTVQITGIYSNDKINIYNSSKVIDGKFTVYGENGEFFWTVYGQRTIFDVEPYKKDLVVKGDGPYKWV